MFKFEQFAKSRQNNNVAEYQDLGFFVDYFVDMAANNSDTDLRKKYILLYFHSLECVCME